MLTISETAKQKILSVIEAEDRKGQGLRVVVRGGGASGFKYDLSLVDEGQAAADDKVVDCNAFKVFLDPLSAERLEGATIDFVEEAMGSGFKINNPNEGTEWTDPKAKIVQELIDSQINPGVAAHGGYVELLDVKDDVVYLRLGGGCQGCGMVDVTLKQGIERLIKDTMPEIQRIVDTTDHAGGTNPYYSPSSK